MHRNIITNYNDSWIVGHREIRKNDDAPWERALRSDWVYAYIGPNNSPIPRAGVVNIECQIGIYPINMEAVVKSIIEAE